MGEELNTLREEILSAVKDRDAKLAEQLANVEKDREANATLARDVKEVNEHIKSLQEQMQIVRDAQTAPVGESDDAPSVTDQIFADDKFKSFCERGWHEGNVVVNLKGFFPQRGATTITSSTVGSATSGILRPDRVADYVPAAQRRLTLRDVLPSRPVTSNAVEFPKENAFTNSASPQTEGSAKSESTLTVTIGTANVRTLAHWIPATAQVLDDWPQLGRIIESKMLYGLKVKEEDEILTGAGTGLHLTGLVTGATAFDTTRIKTSDNIVDYLRHAMAQLDYGDEMGTDFMVLHPNQFWSMVGLKDQASNVGAYLSGSPFAFNNVLRLYGKLMVVSTAMTSGSFLVGNSQMCEIFDRQQASVMISTEHSDYFTKNMVAIRVEERIALAIYRGGSFITGSLATASPL